MNAKRFVQIVLVVLVLVFAQIGVEAQGAPQPPTLNSPGNQSTVTTHSFTLCATGDPATKQLKFEIFQAPIDDFQSPWQTNPCFPINVPNGRYTWHARAMNDNGQSGAAQDWTFTVQADDSPPPTRVPGPQGPTAVADVGPDFNYEFNPTNGTNVGQTATIHITVNCTPNCGEVDTNPSCGGGDQAVNTSGNFDYHWNTNGCGAGGQYVKICSKASNDPQGSRQNCKQPGYELTGSAPPNSPVINSFTADNTTTTGECTTLRWTTTNATSVVLNGQNVNGTGSMQVCPTSSQQFGLRASNGNGNDATGNVYIQVNGVNFPPSNPTAQTPGVGTNRYGSGDLQLDGGQSSPPSAGLYLEIITGQLNVRNGPGANYDVIGKAPFGAYYPIIGGPTNGWYEISYNGGTGWVSGGSSYVSINNGSVPQQPQQNPPSQPAGDCGALAPQLITGQQAMVTQNGKALNLRTGPGKNENLIEVLQPGAIGVVVGGGYACHDGFYWFNIQFGSETGWVAESGDGYYWITPYSGSAPVQPPVQQQTGVNNPPVQLSDCSNAPTTRLEIGGLARITTYRLNLRVSSSTNADVVHQMFINDNDALNILEGPHCSENFWWWRVSTAYGDGWIMEGNSSSYFVGPVYPGHTVFQRGSWSNSTIAFSPTEWDVEVDGNVSDSLVQISAVSVTAVVRRPICGGNADISIEVYKDNQLVWTGGPKRLYYLPITLIQHQVANFTVDPVVEVTKGKAYVVVIEKSAIFNFVNPFELQCQNEENLPDIDSTDLTTRVDIN